MSPRHGFGGDTPSEPPLGAPRRGVAVDVYTDDRDPRRGWVALAAFPVALALVIAALYLTFGVRGQDDDTTEPVPVPSSSATMSPSMSPSLPLETPSPTPSAVAPSEPGSGVDADGATSLTPSPGVTASTAPPAPSAVPIDLGDTVVDVIPGWQLYADETVQNDRRLIRIRELTTDTRIQAVTLTSITGALNDACLQLIADHRQSYTQVAESLAVTVPITGGGEGVACAFTGTRISDEVPNLVEFTILRRADGVALVFRDTIPTAVPDDDPARAQLVAIECDAAARFGVAVAQCAFTPAPADG